MKLIDKILEDFSILEDVNASEVDDFQNPIHIIRLKEVMASYGIQNEIINTIINTITEQDDDEDIITFKHKGETHNVKKQTIRQYASDIEQGKGSEYKSAAVKAAKLDTKDAKKDKEDDSGKLGADDFDTKKSGYLRKKSSGESNRLQNLSDENKKIVGDFEKRVKDRIENLSDDKKTLVNDSLNKVSIVVGNNSWVIELVETLRKIFINTIMLT